MDVFVGGLGGRSRDAIAGVGRQLREVDAPHREHPTGSSLVAIWRDERSSQLHHHLDAELEVVFDGYLHGHGAPTLAEHLPVLARRVATEGRILTGDESGIFSIVVHDRRDGRLLLGGDPSGLLPLHLALGPGGPTFASHGHLLGTALDAPPDHRAVAWGILQKWAPGRRTAYEGVERLCAGELVVVHPDGRVHRSYPETYFSEQVEPTDDVADALWDALTAAVRPLAAEAGPIATMLSEGFDSRLVAGLLRDAGIELELYTHGTEGTAGLEITRRLARTLRAPHHVEPLDQGFPADHDALRRELLLADTLSIPFWMPTGDRIRASGVRAATTGYALDTTAGAHAFVTNEGSRRRAAVDRYRTIALQGAGRLADAEMEAIATRTLAGLRRIDEQALADRVRRFLVPDHAEAVVAEIGGLADDVDAELARIRSSGASLDSQVLQRWFLEGRVRRFSFGQELSLRRRVPLVVPSYEPRFMRLASTVPPRLRVLHDAYLRLFRHHLGDLARIPSGAHGLPATWPRPLLETGRFAAIAREGRLMAGFLADGELDVSRVRSVHIAEITAQRGARLPLEGHAERGVTCLNQPWLDLQAQKIRDRIIRPYVSTLYLPTELAQVLERR